MISGCGLISVRMEEKRREEKRREEGKEGIKRFRDRERKKKKKRKKKRKKRKKKRKKREENQLIIKTSQNPNISLLLSFDTEDHSNKQ